ncbi:MAG TPA: hypothetical protein VIJ42_09495 [Stellaceae bacterium]
MPTVIDSLIIEIGLDPKNLTENQQKAVEGFRKAQAEADQSARSIEASGKRAETFFTGMRNEALGL